MGSRKKEEKKNKLHTRLQSSNIFVALDIALKSTECSLFTLRKIGREKVKNKQRTNHVDKININHVRVCM